MLVAPGRLLCRAGLPVPALNLDFRAGAMPAGLTFTRASTAWAYNSSGVLTSFATNAPRLDHDPVTLQPKGLLIEEARTNLFLNSAVGVTQSCTVAAAANTLSFFGTGTVTLTGTSTAGPLVGTGAANRVSLTFTPTAGSLTLTVSGSCTNVQLELGAFATSPIVTVGSTVTRAADLCTMALGSWFNAAEGTVTASADRVGAGAYGRLVQLDDTTNDNVVSAISADAGSARIYAYVADGGVAQVDTAAAANDVALNTAFSVGLAYRLNDYAFTLNGGTVTADASATVPTVTRLAVGAANGSSLNGHVRSVRYFNRRLPDGMLRVLTSWA